MKILYLVHARPFDPQEILSGNTIRAHALAQGLLRSGHEVLWVFPQDLWKQGTPLPPGHAVHGSMFDLQGIMGAFAPDAILVGYWELLGDLPPEIKLPVLLDFLAPRPLEALFEGVPLDAEVKKMARLFPRADHFFVGSSRQAVFLLPWLLLFGLDHRNPAPITVLPLGLEEGPEPEKSFAAPFTFATAGVTWPWRQDAPYLEALLQAIEEEKELSCRVLRLSGSYVYAKRKAESQISHPLLQERPLLPYGAFLRFLRAEAHIGLEVSAPNLEREMSLSFRAVEYLRSGVPVVVNDFLSIAPLVEQFNAGWVVQNPGDMKKVLCDLKVKGMLEEKSQGARALFLEHFSLGKVLPKLEEVLQDIDKKKAIWLSPPGFAGMQSQGLSQEGHLARVLVQKDFRRGIRLFRLGTSRLRDDALRLLKRLRAFILASRDFDGQRALPEKGVARALWDALWGRREPGRHVLMLTRADWHPPVHGAAVKITRTAQELSKRVDSVVLATGDPGRFFVFRKGEMQTYLYPALVRLSGLGAAFSFVRLHSLKVPRSEWFLYQAIHDPGFFIKTAYLSLLKKYFLAQAEFPGFLAPLLWLRRFSSFRVILAEHNVEFLRLQDQYPLLPKAAKWLKEKEVCLASKADAVGVVSRLDEEKLIQAGVPKEKLFLLPHGVDIEAFREAKALNLRALYGFPPTCAILVYHGIYAYAPNKEAVEILDKEILPRLAARGIETRVLAIGAQPMEKGFSSQVTFTGAVPELAPYLKGADVAVVPLVQGGGTRMKILEYFAAGIPVVATPKAIEGIPIEDGVHALIREGWDEMADAVARVLQDEEMKARLVQNALSWVSAYTWGAVAEKILAWA